MSLAFFKNKRFYNFVIVPFVILLSGIIRTVCVEVFTLPYDFAPGGSTGIAAMVEYKTGFSAAWTTLIVNAPLLILAFFLISKDFAIKTGAAIGVASAGMLVFEKLDLKVYENGEPVRVSSVVVSAQHAPDVSQEKIREAVIERVIKRVVPQKLLKGADIFVNPTGRFVVGGPAGDTGVTGRKIIVDTYGGAIPHGGGAFSGKDASKVDRSASYYARYVCKNAVAAGLCSKMMLQVGYAIGKARPVSLFVDTFGTGDDERIRAAVERVFDFRPAALIDKLGLKKPIFRLTTNYGHFGKAELPWEKTDAVEAIKAVY